MRSIQIVAKSVKKKRKAVDRTIGGLLTANEAKTAHPLDDFMRDLMPTFQTEILDSISGVGPQEIVNFLDFVYSVATAMGNAEHAVAVAIKTTPLIRAQRMVFSKARVQIARSLDLLHRAKPAVDAARKSLKRGVLRVRPAEEALRQLKQTLEELEIQCAELIHPAKRTPYEEGLAARFPYKSGHVPLPVTPGSAKINYDVTELLDAGLRQFTRGQVPSSHIDRFISKFFAAALGRSVTDENVKLMRIRIRKDRKKSDMQNAPGSA